MKPSKLMVMAGGTGGHVYPALAVATSLRAQGTDITWLGTRGGLEARVVPEHDIPMRWISIEGIRGKGKAALLLAPFKLLHAMWQSARAIRAEQPDCILGMGGFVAGPGGLVARMMGKPLVVHEQNAVAGLTNHYLAKIASKVLSGFPNVKGLPERTIWVGNPVRKEIGSVARSESEQMRVLVIGGSQGAFSFNQYLPAAFAKQNKAKLSVWHQTGRGNQSEVQARYAALNMDARVSEFIDDMAAAYAWADLLVCRAGAMTIAECCAASKPALLIPYPFSAGDHQEFNADTMVRVGAAKKVANSQIQQTEFDQALADLLRSKQQLKQMGESAHTLHKQDALDQVASLCSEYL